MSKMLTALAFDFLAWKARPPSLTLTIHTGFHPHLIPDISLLSVPFLPTEQST